MKALLEEEIDSGDLKSDILKTTKKLKTWVNNTLLYLQLQWFDTVEQVEISTKLRKRRWNTEVTACDTLGLVSQLPFLCTCSDIYPKKDMIRLFSIIELTVFRIPMLLIWFRLFTERYPRMKTLPSR